MHRKGEKKGAQFPAQGNYLFNQLFTAQKGGRDRVKKDTKKPEGVVSWWRN